MVGVSRGDLVAPFKARLARGERRKLVLMVSIDARETLTVIREKRNLSRLLLSSQTVVLKGQGKQHQSKYGFFVQTQDALEASNLRMKVQDLTWYWYNYDLACTDGNIPRIDYCGYNKAENLGLSRRKAALLNFHSVVMVGVPP